MKIVIFLLIAAVLAGAAVLYGLFGEGADNQVAGEDTAEVSEQDEIESTEPVVLAGEGSLENLKQLGAQLECTITYDSPDLDQSIVGTYFVNVNNIRGDFEMTVPEMGGSFVSSIIFKEDMFYSWSVINGQSYGVKVNTAQMSDVDSETLREPVPSDVDVIYNCTEWKNVDNSIFEPPSTVLFQDLSTIMQSGMEYGTVYDEGEF